MLEQVPQSDYNKIIPSALDYYRKFFEVPIYDVSFADFKSCSDKSVIKVIEVNSSNLVRLVVVFLTYKELHGLQPVSMIERGKLISRCQFNVTTLHSLVIKVNNITLEKDDEFNLGGPFIKQEPWEIPS